LQKRRAALKFGKVAICLSGLIRTGVEAHPVFRKFFSTLENYDVFYHTWKNPLSNKIQQLYTPTSFLEESPLDNTRESSFGSMLYSIMMANELKKQYEIQNNFRYDLVIKTRFDLIFPENNYFPTASMTPRTIYSVNGNHGINHTDYENHGISDLIFWGDSQSMDIATNIYRHYKYTTLVNDLYLKNGWKMDVKDYYLSPGTMIYQRTITQNIAHVRMPSIGEVPWREDVKKLDPVKDFQKIKTRYANQ
jgi:hypothetical protein